MGVNDDREMLEAAQEECIRLEREVADMRKRQSELAHSREWRRARTASIILLEEDLVGARAVIRAAALAMMVTPAGFRSRFWDRTRELLAMSPAAALAEHDRGVQADALEEAAAHITHEHIADALRARAAGIRKAGTR